MDVLTGVGIDDEREMDRALLRTIQVCRSLDIPLDRNFLMVYRNDGRDLLRDWKLSNLACSLLLLNANTANEIVARTQIELIKNIDQYKPHSFT